MLLLMTNVLTKYFLLNRYLALPLVVFQHCSHCNETGAMIGCLNKGCQQKYHHACAQLAGNIILTCVFFIMHS